jgi:hypothetical protein
VSYNNPAATAQQNLSCFLSEGKIFIYNTIEKTGTRLAPVLWTFPNVQNRYLHLDLTSLFPAFIL